MRRKTLWLLIAGITFIVGVASGMYRLNYPNSRGLIKQPVNSESVGDAVNIHVCLKSFDLNLGDSFDQVNSFIRLNPDPNGSNQNIFWQQGKLTDFFSISQPPIKIDKENQLNPSIFCKFDDRKRLKSFSISWTHEGQQSDLIKRKIVNTLIEREHICMAGKSFEFNNNKFTDKVEGENYVQEFEYDFGNEASFWVVRYSIEIK